MSLEVHSLASGSSGNIMLVRGKHGDLLVDCGMSRSFVEESLAQLGASPERLRAILLTHEHGDHARGAMAVARRYSIPIMASAGTLQHVVGDKPVETRPIVPFHPMEMDEFCIVGYPVSHDAREPLALAIHAGKVRICYAVDLGKPEESLLQACREASLVVLESNHDLKRLTQGPYDLHLKERILGQQGHLSNQDAAEVITQVTASGQHTRFWLAHLSAVNNTPRIALRSAARALRDAGKSHCSVEVALRDRPSLHWSANSHWWQPTLSLEW